MSAVSDFIPTKKIKRKNTPLWITSEIIHALRKKEAARSKLKKSPTDHQRQKYRELRTKAKILIRESREIYFSSLDSDFARQPIRCWSFFKLKNKTRTFPETMSSGDDNQHFSGRLETREYCTHFQERKERLCGELPPYFPSPCHFQSSRALCSGGSTRSHNPPHQSRTAWLFSW